MKLISLSEYVKFVDDNLSKYSTKDARKKDGYDMIFNYHKFLQTPLKLSLFVPCYKDEDIAYTEPFCNKFSNFETQDEILNYRKYQEYKSVKSTVMFKDIKVQIEKEFVDFYGGIRVYTYSNDILVDRSFGEVFTNGKPRYHKTIGDLVKYDLEIIGSF